MRVKFIIGWLYAIILCLIYGLLLSAYGCLLRFHDHFYDTRSSFLPHLFLALPAVFIGCCFGVSWFCRKRNLDSRGHWRFALLVLLTIPIACLMHDALPIEHDYSMRDIVPGDQKILASYDTLMLFRKEGSMKVETTSDYPQLLTNDFANLITNALAYSESISHAWDSIAEARSVIEKLDTYPGIADLTPQVQLGPNTPILNFMTLRSISLTYAAFANLKTAEGHPEEGVQHLAKFQSVARKALPHSAILIDKMIWMAIANNNIKAAFAILQQPQCTPETLKILKEAFPPISEEDVSLRRVFIGEYVWRKTLFGAELRPSTFLDAFVMTRVGVLPKSPSFFRKAASSFVYYLTFRKNRTFRDFRKYNDLLVEGASRHPPDMSQANRFMDDYGRHPDIRNLGGWCLVSMAMPSYMRASGTAVKTKILSDLLAIEIGNRLNQPVVLDDYYSAGPYGRDKRTGRVFSVGPDKKPNTDDDIVLGKN
ncbi:MAG: hypothetical protein L6437_05615 [Kiritimatiellae bacterium]|nr:hypothetical protein [Verrucomicrobiota bacterium]MCG2659704.1 hypothetical protein [Kiritimatiellia bacterium]